MNLRELLSPLLVYDAAGELNMEITGISTDSRKVKPGNLFVALRGNTVDGHDYIEQAHANGAIAFLVEEDQDVPDVTIKVSDTTRALAILADQFYNHPTSKLQLIGVTGTNGKTTVTHLVEQILNNAGCATGIIGTIQMRMGDYTEEVKNTTPDALELQRMFAIMVERGATHACIEVSSHALEMGRVWGCNFTSGIFTNLTQDHLDYHQTMDNYRHAKSLLFSQLGNIYNDKRKFAILNMDDPSAARYRKMTAAQVITYAIDQEADVRALDISIGAGGTSFTLRTFKGEVTIEMKMMGKFSVYNVLAATAACLVEGITLSQIKESIEQMTGVPGRFEPVDEGQGFAVIVDYAHTPDSLENVLTTAREFTKGKLYCLVGCGGDRDRTKRPIMGRIAAEQSDYVIFTSDNPRSEDPKAILDDMLQGVTEKSTAVYECIIDRKQAIEKAIALATSGDCIIIAGKGHETYQIIKGQVLDFDDREVASFAIRNRIK
ncbi:UDP-N-acetylmuramoyl-L-alanyl-D-glutamate--2,6-diaminopimelate ligase [Ammoniphilus sp. CFH 90114]|uniref:UDP-N-acetylmuramoyl-L-alanyl-D-glutamate--2, 6-diaminopimelate ligase n=1 Tax=Ammoniphilus sp. CFH 90114 TaxID=2493665 RepID=UPI00100F8753|nr:UDP-N-acetylmuramoyl-L-alanyl-D-glutamate--2,6-diaminopimelate ligase [Ammoniphilus sp. CFH 90114]RXT15002.1 UDP-N-acetylmuramoyl-L-alanyl-D-glutamate--2,6-diaminopimelate ligase [Ammoniphilus sp. CFH 90114]